MNRSWMMAIGFSAWASLLLCCGSAFAAESSASSPDTEHIEVTEVPWTGDLDGMMARGWVRVLVPYSKTFYWVDLGRPRGLSYELFTAFEKELNSRSGLPKDHQVHVLFVPTRRDDLMPALLNGKGDIAVGGLAITEQRSQEVDFATPVLTGIREIVVSGPEAPAFATLEDLSGKVVSVRKSSSYYEHLQALNAKWAQQGKAPIRIREVSEALEDEDILQMVDAGLLRTTVVDDFRAKAWAARLKNLKVHEDMVLHDNGQIAWMIRKNSPLLRARLDGFVKTKCTGKSFGAVLYQRYLTEPSTLKSARGRDAIKSYDRTVAYFQKYGDKYDVDHLLMMAQGYQESRLEQSARSPVGAIGVMQIMPATGQELRVGDITEVEPNIHGGVKYVRSLIDRSFKDPGIDRDNQVFFAFAAYNCGPGCLDGLRKEARKQGLDPNVWFNNVEVIAAKRIGPETVTYVANILKYYTAYKDHEEELQQAANAAPAPSK
jgi:membrane-bound lytic murein transglycosylase MltF